MLPEDCHYSNDKMHRIDKSSFKFCASTKDISVANVDDWLLEFEDINEVNLKRKSRRNRRNNMCDNVTTGASTTQEYPAPIRTPNEDWK